MTLLLVGRMESSKVGRVIIIKNTGEVSCERYSMRLREEIVQHRDIIPFLIGIEVWFNAITQVLVEVS